MNADLLFSLSGSVAMAGWATLLAGVLIPSTTLRQWAQRLAGLAFPLLLSVAYAALVLAFWYGAPGGFDTLPSVMRLFDTPQIALAGWIHYLAFDLFVGAWIARRAAEEELGFVLVAPCLVLTFLFGPAGYLAFSALRAARTATRRSLAA